MNKFIKIYNSCTYIMFFVWNKTKIVRKTRKERCNILSTKAWKNVLQFFIFKIYKYVSVPFFCSGLFFSIRWGFSFSIACRVVLSWTFWYKNKVKCYLLQATMSEKPNTENVKSWPKFVLRVDRYMCNYLTSGRKTRLAFLSSSLKVWILLKVCFFYMLMDWQDYWWIYFNLQIYV